MYGNREAYEDLCLTAEQCVELKQKYENLLEEFNFTDGALKELKNDYVELKTTAINNEKEYKQEIKDLKRQLEWVKGVCSSLTKLALKVMEGDEENDY